jgi:L-rhamnose mutarotase
MKKFYLALDLADDADLIRQYEDHHKPENERKAITESIRSAGITNMEIFRTGNRLFMIMETADDFDFTRKAQMDADNAEVQEWEALVLKFQQPLPWAAPGEKWVLMKKIYELPK